MFWPLSLEEHKVAFVAVCRFTLNSEVNLKAALISMGLGNMFNLATADFTRITSESNNKTEENRQNGTDNRSVNGRQSTPIFAA